jgi:hypothetical protein
MCSASALLLEPMPTASFKARSPWRLVSEYQHISQEGPEGGRARDEEIDGSSPDRITCGGSFGRGGLLSRVKMYTGAYSDQKFFLGKFGSQVGMRIRGGVQVIGRVRCGDVGRLSLDTYVIIVAVYVLL